MNSVARLACIELISSDCEGAAGFYQAAFGFEQRDDKVVADPAYAEVVGIPHATAHVITLQLGEQRIELAEIAPVGRSYPADIPVWSPLFQHFAIVVLDMATAYARLRTTAGWRPISTNGPHRLPAASGGVTAFKFRDPEGHPLELIAFPRDATPAPWRKPPAGECIGVDHSAISVANTDRSVAFYERLGLRRRGGSLNVGQDQDRLDDLADTHVEVTALALPHLSTPHVELLCYRGGPKRRLAPAVLNDIAATRLIFAVDSVDVLRSLCDLSLDALVAGPAQFRDYGVRAMLRDPDGHLIVLEALSPSEAPVNAST